MTLTARTKALAREQRRNMVELAKYPYTILTMTADGEDVAGYWRIQTPSDERMFVEYASSEKIYRKRESDETVDVTLVRILVNG